MQHTVWTVTFRELSGCTPWNVGKALPHFGPWLSHLWTGKWKLSVIFLAQIARVWNSPDPLNWPRRVPLFDGLIYDDLSAKEPFLCFLLLEPTLVARLMCC